MISRSTQYPITRILYFTLTQAKLVERLAPMQNETNT